MLFRTSQMPGSSFVACFAPRRIQVPPSGSSLKTQNRCAQAEANPVATSKNFL